MSMIAPDDHSFNEKYKQSGHIEHWSCEIVL